MCTGGVNSCGLLPRTERTCADSSDSSTPLLSTRALSLARIRSGSRTSCTSVRTTTPPSPSCTTGSSSPLAVTVALFASSNYKCKVHPNSGHTQISPNSGHTPIWSTEQLIGKWRTSVMCNALPPLPLPAYTLASWQGLPSRLSLLSLPLLAPLPLLALILPH